MSQPAISQHMRALEELCGVKLVERVGNSIIPTSAGAALQSSVRQLVRVERDLESVIGSLRDGNRGSIILGANTTGGMYVAPRVIRAFRHSSPEVEVKLAIADTPSILEGLIERSIDLAIVGGPVDPHRFQVQDLCPDELVAVASADHDLASRERLTLHELAMYPLILPATGSTTRAFILQRFREEQVHAQIGMEFTATENIKKAVESNLGVAVISRWAIERELALGILSELPVDGFPLSREYQLAGRKGGARAPAINRFIEVAEGMRDQLQLQH